MKTNLYQRAKDGVRKGVALAGLALAAAGCGPEVDKSLYGTFRGNRVAVHLFSDGYTIVQMSESRDSPNWLYGQKRNGVFGRIYLNGVETQIAKRIGWKPVPNASILMGYANPDSLNVAEDSVRAQNAGGPQ